MRYTSFMKAENNIGGLLGKSSRLLSNRFNNELVSLGLTVQQWTLLAVLWKKNPQTQKALQEALLKDKASINSLVGNLIKSGFITKEQNPDDRRSFLVSLSKKGIEIQSKSIPLAMSSISVATQGIAQSEIDIFTKVAQQIILNLTKDKT